MRNLESPLFKAHSSAATFKSRWIDARQCASLHIHVRVAATGSPVGAFTIEESNDPAVARGFDTGLNQDSTSDSVSAVDISAATPRVTYAGTGFTVNGANTTMFVIEPPAAYVRLVYTRTSGGAAGTMDAWIMGKSNG